jgi:hypothetical protein
MKTKGYIIIVFIALGCLVSFISSPKNGAECTGDDEYAVGIGSLGAYSLIKDYRINMKVGEDAPNFMISLKAGLKYRFLPIQNPDNKKKMIMSIYMNQQKGMMLATSFNKATGKHYPTIDFACRTTGSFYIFFEMEDGEKGCGVGMFSVAN